MRATSPLPPPPAAPSLLLRGALLCLLLCLPRETAAAPSATIDSLLPLVADTDPGTRLHARHAIKRIVVAHYRRLAPAGMRLIPGRVVVEPGRVAMEGGFYLSTHEVTEVEFARSLSKSTDVRGERGRAATMVTLASARAYAARQGARLPTAPELERAARGDARFRYPWGDRFDARLVNSREGGYGELLDPGALAGGESPWGIADLLGNAAEWTETTNGKQGERLRYLVVGGSFRCHVRRAGFVTYRLRADECQPDVGFRLARDLPPLPIAAAAR